MFKKDAIGSVIQECDFHPRRFLSRFNRIIVEALGKDVKEITSEFAGTVPEACMHAVRLPVASVDRGQWTRLSQTHKKETWEGSD